MASNSVCGIVICKLCSEHYTDPRMLPCLHSFCYDCLSKHFDNSKSDHVCPTCNEAFEVPNGKIKSLPKDLHGSHVAEVAEYEEKIAKESTMNCDRCSVSSDSEAVKFCCNCCNFLCSWCTKDHARRTATRKHELVDVGGKSKSLQKSLLNSIQPKRMSCPLHSDEVLKFYCYSKGCSCLVCRDCILLSHSGHTYDHVDAVADKEREDMLSIVENASNAIKKLENAMGKNEKVAQNISNKQNSVEQKIKESFKELYEVLHDREDTLLAKSAEISLGKITALKLQSEDIKKMYDELNRISQLVKEATKEYTPEQMLSTKGIMTAKFDKVMKQFDACSLEPCKTDIMHSDLESAQIKEDIGKFGAVTGGSYAAGSTALFFMPVAIKGKAVNISVTTRDIQGKPLYQKGEAVVAKLGLIGSNNLDVEGTVKDNGNGIYDITLTPQSVGEHQLNVTVEGEHIKSSPFVISVREARQYTTNCLQNYGVSSQPWDVAMGDNNEMFVVDYGYHYIQVMNKQNATTVRTIGLNGSSGTGNLQFYSPSAITIKGNVMYIAEDGNHRIQKLTTSGKHLTTFGSNGSKEGQFRNPRGICIGPENKLYVTEYSNNRISVFQADGTFDHFITGNLFNPWGIAFDPQGNINVANYGSHTISVFTIDGNFLRQYGSGTIQYPAGIAIDPEGYVFVSEYYNSGYYDDSRVFIFNPQYVHTNTLQNFQYSVGIALDKDGYVYVCDYNNSRVLKY